MVNLKIEQNQSKFNSKIWQIARNLRGNSIGWDFKQYILGILFYHFISEKLCAHINEIQKKSGESKFNYVTLSDNDADRFRKSVLNEMGYFVLPSELFENVRKQAESNSNVSKLLEATFKNIETSAKGTKNEDIMKGLFDDFGANNSKLGSTEASRNKNLAKLLNCHW